MEFTFPLAGHQRTSKRKEWSKPFDHFLEYKCVGALIVYLGNQITIPSHSISQGNTEYTKTNRNRSRLNYQPSYRRVFSDCGVLLFLLFYRHLDYHKVQSIHSHQWVQISPRLDSMATLFYVLPTVYLFSPIG